MWFERPHSAWIAASVITVASFIGATVYTQNRLARLDALSSAIERNAVPSLEDLSRVAVRLTRLNQLFDDLAVPDRRWSATIDAARREVAAVEADLGRYRQLPLLSGERTFEASLQQDSARAIGLVRTALDADQRAGAPVADDEEVDAAIDRAVRSVLAALDYDVGASEAMARDVRTVRVSTLDVSLALEGAATLIAAFAVVMAFRASRRHEELLRAHNSLLASRVSELDRFAGRVAHDVLSPLGTIASALPLLADGCDDRGRTYIERSERALRRVKELVEALLTFARSGARPDPSARCAVDAVLAGIVGDCAETAAEMGIEISVEASRRVEVACDRGVIASIVQNLVHNALKYMGARPVRRIVVRARQSGAVARIEVEDTGSGIPAELQDRIFEPFVRGSRDEVSGTGLGLATVKRLVESHGGAVGVRSQPDRGSLFWVELPLLPATGEAAAPPITPQRV